LHSFNLRLGRLIFQVSRVDSSIVAAPMALKAFQRSGQVELISKKMEGLDVSKNHPGFFVRRKMNLFKTCYVLRGMNSSCLRV